MADSASIAYLRLSAEKDLQTINAFLLQIGLCDYADNIRNYLRSGNIRYCVTLINDYEDGIN